MLLGFDRIGAPLKDYRCGIKLKLSPLKSSRGIIFHMLWKINFWSLEYPKVMQPMGKGILGKFSEVIEKGC